MRTRPSSHRAQLFLFRPTLTPRKKSILFGSNGLTLKSFILSDVQKWLVEYNATSPQSLIASYAKESFDLCLQFKNRADEKPIALTEADAIKIVSLLHQKELLNQKEYSDIKELITTQLEEMKTDLTYVIIDNKDEEAEEADDFELISPTATRTLNNRGS